MTYVTESYTIGQLPITVTNSGTGGFTTPEFSAYCSNVFSGLSLSPDSYGTSGQPNSALLNATGGAGRIGFLYNQYGSVLSATSLTPSCFAGV